MTSNDPRLLYAIKGINAYHIVDGTEQSLTPSGPQTLSLLMVPTSSAFADQPGIEPNEEDFYLHLHLPPELDLPMPATTQIYHQPPTSYLIPRWDLGPDSGAFTRIEFPRVGSRSGIQEDVDTFETILAQCTAFLERAPAPNPRSSKSTKSSRAAQEKKREAMSEPLPAYDPSDYTPGQSYAAGSQSSTNAGGRIVLVDEEDGSVIGELTENYQLLEDQKIRPGSKEPVEITLPSDGKQSHIAVMPAPEGFVEPDHHPAYSKSTIVNSATKASRLIVTTSDVVARTMQAQAEQFTKSTKPASKPITFAPTTHDRIRRINTFSDRAATMSSATVGTIGNVAQNLGATLGRRKDGRARGYDKDGNMIETYKPGILNKSMLAFNTVAGSIEQAGRNLLTGTSSSINTVVGHRWGAEAGEVSQHMTGGFKNVGLVYIDVAGVSRRAILKSVAKGMVVGQVKGGGEVIVGGTDGNPTLVPRPNESAAGTDYQSTYGGDTASLSGLDPNSKRPHRGPY